MRILVFDYSGHPFAAQLCRLLAARGRDVVHGHCEAYESGKGQLSPAVGDVVRYESIGAGRRISKYEFRKRLFQELVLGAELAAMVRRERPDVVLIANTPLPTLSVAAAALWLFRTPWVLWQQDLNFAALASLAARRGTPILRSAAVLMVRAERWCSRRASRIVVIADAFKVVHARWGTLGKTAVIPNWAPLEEIVPRERCNDWAREHGLEQTVSIMYCGTLGLKHNPSLLVSLTREVRELGSDSTLVVVSEGPAVGVLGDEARRQGVPLVLAPFQPYARLSDVLGSADVLVVLLEPDASAFSVPSKALSYLCAGRPVLGLLPAANAAATLLGKAGGLVLPPAEESIATAARWVVAVTSNPHRARELGSAARSMAESEFAVDTIVTRFDELLAATQAGRSQRFSVAALRS